jgi:hypothetical protein
MMQSNNETNGGLYSRIVLMVAALGLVGLLMISLESESPAVLLSAEDSVLHEPDDPFELLGIGLKDTTLASKKAAVSKTKAKQEEHDAKKRAVHKKAKVNDAKKSNIQKAARKATTAKQAVKKSAQAAKKSTNAMIDAAKAHHAAVVAARKAASSKDPKDIAAAHNLKKQAKSEVKAAKAKAKDARKRFKTAAAQLGKSKAAAQAVQRPHSSQHTTKQVQTPQASHPVQTAEPVGYKALKATVGNLKAQLKAAATARSSMQAQIARQSVQLTKLRTQLQQSPALKQPGAKPKKQQVNKKLKSSSQLQEELDRYKAKYEIAKHAIKDIAEAAEQKLAAEDIHVVV